MFCLDEKLLHILMFPFGMEEHHQASLRVFRLKMSELINSQPLLKAGENRSEMVMPAAWFNNCFETVHAAKEAFSELVAEIEYPMGQWGAAATDEYLRYSLSLLNSISSSVSHLKLLKISLLHDVDSPNSAANDAEKCGSNHGGGLDVEGLRPGSEKKERVILEALMELKEVVVSTLSLVVSGLSAGELREKLEVVENAILGIKKQTNDLFSEELASRNELLENIRFLM